MALQSHSDPRLAHLDRYSVTISRLMARAHLLRSTLVSTQIEQTHSFCTNDITAPRSNETATSNPIHSIPRGPPRKPKQSVFALWVGNIPPRTDILALKDHFSKDATNDIESVFLISKSNCAFVNYRTEEASKAALTRLHGVRFNGARLVCRLRQTEDSTATEERLAGNTTGGRQDSHVGLTVQSKYSLGGDAIDGMLSSGAKDLSDNPTSSANSTDSLNIQRPTCQSANEASLAETHRGEDANKGSGRYFIMKSLTSEDLDTSVREGTWTTQSHNEKTLNEAYQVSYSQLDCQELILMNCSM